MLSSFLRSMDWKVQWKPLGKKASYTIFTALNILLNKTNYTGQWEYSHINVNCIVDQCLVDIHAVIYKRH